MLNNHVLKSWFQLNKRDLPWRSLPTPYQVWVSEMMLQQTQVAVVIPYYLRWMEHFPDVQSLANASIDQVIKVWEGLGYYSRARFLHSGAKKIVAQFSGQIPDQLEKLQQIPGLGPYTSAAILSFAFKKRVAAVDGNVIRVLTRYWGIADDIAKAATLKKLRTLLEEQLPVEESWVTNEALIELGATICQKKPRCTSCPLKLSCKAFASQLQATLPFKSTKVKIETLARLVAVIESGDKLLVKQVEEGKIMSGLHEFPYWEVSSEPTENEVYRLLESLGLKTFDAQKMAQVNQSFTRFRAILYPYKLKCQKEREIAGFKWVKKEELPRLAFSSGHRKIFKSLQCV